MAAQDKAWICTGAAAAMSLLPLGLFLLPPVFGLGPTTIVIIAGAMLHRLYRAAITPRRDDEPRIKVLSGLPQPALVALWIAPWTIVLGLVFFAPQIGAATGMNVQSLAVFGALGLAWFALSVAMIAAAIENQRRVTRRRLPDA